MPDTVANLAIEHILKQISARDATNASSPLLVGLWGVQGIGKTTLTRAITSSLTSAPHSLRIVTLSIDDLYFEHEKLQEVGLNNPGNALLQGRGMPGTHDVELGRTILMALSLMGRKSPENTAESVSIPAYDKSLQNGTGDRMSLEHWTRVQPPVDVVVMEGWCFGSGPPSDDILMDRWERRRELGMPDSVGLENGIQDIKTVIQNLRQYGDAWYGYFNCFIEVTPVSLQSFGIIYQWRIQQEHAMKAENGGRGMSDEQVARFVDRYIPGYIFFDQPSAHTSEGCLQSWCGNGLKIMVDEERIPVKTEFF